jgi:hypothetical protein
MLVLFFVYYIEKIRFNFWFKVVSRQARPGYVSIYFVRRLVRPRLHRLLRVGRVVAVPHHLHVRSHRRNISARIHFGRSGSNESQISNKQN